MPRFVPALLFALLVAAPVARAAGGGDVVVQVTAPGKKPAQDVAVSLGVKAWPGETFQLRTHDGKTDAKGRATLADVVPAGTRYGLYVTALAPGWTLASAYAWYGSAAPAAPVELSIAPAVPLRLRLVDDAGTPVKGAAAAPAMRSDAAGVRHTLRADPPDAIVVMSGADGTATLSFFLPGEWVGVSVRFPGRSWETRTLLVPAAKDAVVDVASAAPTTPDRELLAGGNPDQRLFLTGPKAGDVEPEKGFGLVLVLPGGDGSADFRPWVHERYDEWVDAGWLWVQLVAPKWNASQQVVWPTEAVRADGMKFTTEAFVAAAVEEVARHGKVDRRRVVAVSWSSSGPTCWRMLSAKSSPVTAHLIAMSAFHPQGLESLANARQRPLFLLHSPDDKTCPIALAQQGREAAKKAGLKVEWATYEGGHGWTGESEDAARRGLHWLSEALR